MTDRDRHHLRGPVQSVRCEFAGMDAQTGVWEPMKGGSTFSFDRAGREEGRRDRRPIMSTVDERGLKTTEGSWAPQVPRPPGLEYGIGFCGPVEISYLTRYDANDRPAEVAMRDAHQEVRRRIFLSASCATRATHVIDRNLAHEMAFE